MSKDGTNLALSPEQQILNDAWEEHLRCEFVSKDVDGTMATMIEGGHVNHVPTMTGGVGLPEIRYFYSHYFIPQMPPDAENQLISRTIGENQIVEELVFKFTHTVPMAWMLPGVEPTGKRVEVPLVVIIGFREGKVQHEHIYWDQASVLLQLGLIESDKLPIVGADSARKVVEPSALPSNSLIS